MTITLTTTGSRDVTIDIEPAALPEAAGGIAIHCGLYDGPLIFTLTAEEASQARRGDRRSAGPRQRRRLDLTGDGIAALPLISAGLAACRSMTATRAAGREPGRPLRRGGRRSR